MNQPVYFWMKQSNHSICSHLSPIASRFCMVTRLRTWTSVFKFLIGDVGYGIKWTNLTISFSHIDYIIVSLIAYHVCIVIIFVSSMWENKTMNKITSVKNYLCRQTLSLRDSLYDILFLKINIRKYNSQVYPCSPLQAFPLNKYRYSYMYRYVKSLHINIKTTTFKLIGVFAIIRKALLSKKEENRKILFFHKRIKWLIKIENPWSNLRWRDVLKISYRIKNIITLLKRLFLCIYKVS